MFGQCDHSGIERRLDAIASELSRLARAVEEPLRREDERREAEARLRRTERDLAGMEVLTSNVGERCRCGHRIEAHTHAGCRYADSEGLCLCPRFEAR